MGTGRDRQLRGEPERGGELARQVRHDGDAAAPEEHADELPRAERRRGVEVHHVLAPPERSGVAGERPFVGRADDREGREAARVPLGGRARPGRPLVPLMGRRRAEAQLRAAGAGAGPAEHHAGVADAEKGRGRRAVHIEAAGRQRDEAAPEGAGVVEGRLDGGRVVPAIVGDRRKWRPGGVHDAGVVHREGPIAAMVAGGGEVREAGFAGAFLNEVCPQHRLPPRGLGARLGGILVGASLLCTEVGRVALRDTGRTAEMEQRQQGQRSGPPARPARRLHQYLRRRSVGIRTMRVKKGLRTENDPLVAGPDAGPGAGSQRV